MDLVLKFSTDDDNSQPPNQNKIDGADEVIFSLHQQLRDNGGDKEEFNRNFEKIIAKKNQLNQRQIQWLNESSPTGLNFLMLACKYGNVEAVGFLISCGTDLSKSDDYVMTASDYAWQHRNLDCLVELLKADSPFPKNFDHESIEAPNFALKLMILKMQNFHKTIEDGDLEKVKSFVTKNPKIRFAYNEQNQCALTTALKAEKGKIYIFLRNNFFNAGLDSKNHRAQLEILHKNDKKYLRKHLKDHFKKPVVSDLLAKSRNLSVGNNEKIIAFYEKLNEIPEISPILQLVAKSQETDIVFDFNSSDIFVMDPTAMNSHGRTFHASGHILIGAGREESEVLGTLAHELTHWALQLTYKNKCQPFYADDDRQNSYQKIVNNAFIDCIGNCSIISDVFKYEEDHWNAELIVRVPQLMAIFKNNGKALQEYKNECRLDEIFGYYKNEVLQDIKKDVKLFDDKENIRKMNKTFGVFKGLKNLNKLSSECKKLPNTDENLAIKTNLPDLVLEYIFKTKSFDQRDFTDAVNVFVTKDDFLKAENLDMIKEAAESIIRPNFIIFDQGKNSGCRKIDENLANLLEKSKVFYISTTHQTCFENFCFLKIEIDFTWNDLNDQAKTDIMESKIVFQDSEVKLLEITDIESLLKEEPLEILLNLSSFNFKGLNKALPERPRVFIKRKFKADEYVFDDLSNFLFANKTVLIADSAGLGKSTSAAQLSKDLKEKNKLLWVVFIDLKQHTKVFFPDKQAETEIVGVRFFAEKLLMLKTEFESKLFESFYASKNVVFIIDGFDEISPKYKKFVLNILQAIKNSKNNLLVTTRPHFTSELEQRFETKAIHLLPLNEEDQIEFLTKFWNLESKHDELRSRIELFLKKFQTDDFCATPIHIFMLAEVFAGTELKNIDEKSLNLFSLYEKFIEKKLKIWNEEKGKLAKDDSVALQNTFPPVNCKTIFSRLAVEQMFSSKMAEKLKIPEVPDEIIDETIARVGIVAFSLEGTAQFTHRTYAEFFVADLIANQAFKKKPKNEFVDLFVKIILKTENFEQIWKFLNDKLEKMDDFDTEALAITFERIFNEMEYWREIKDENYYHSLIENMPLCSKLISFILETLNLSKNSKKKLLMFFWKNFGDRFEYFSIIWRCAQKIRDQKEELLKKLLSTKVRGFDFFIKALNHEEKIKAIESERASKVVLEYAESSLNGKDFKKLFFDDEKRSVSIEHMMKLDEDYFFKLWALAEKKLKKKNLKKLAQSKNWGKQTILHLIVENEWEVLNWLQILKSLLAPQEFDEHLTAGDLYSNSFIDEIVHKKEDLEKIKSCWKFIEENSRLETQEKLLMSENGELLIEDAFDNGDESVTDFIFDISDSLLQKTEGKTFIAWLRAKDRLTYVIHNMVVLSDVLFDKYSSKLDAEEFRNLLLIKSSQLDFNVFHCFVGHKNSRSTQLWNRIVEKIDDLEAIKVLLFEIGNYGNVFFHAAELNNPFLIEILEWCKTTFDHEFITKIFTEKDELQRTLLHIVALWGDKNLTLKCLEFVSNTFELEEQREMLQKKNILGEFPIETSFFNENQEVTDIWVEFYEKLLEKEELKEIIFSESDTYSREYLKRKVALEERWENKSGL